MKLESDEGFVSLIAKDDAEAKLLVPIMEAINSENTPAPACLVDNRVDPDPQKWIINGILQLQIS